MSNGMEGEALVAGAILVPAAAVGLALGAGWLAWQAGKLAVGASVAAYQYGEEQKRLEAERERQRVLMAQAAHNEVIVACRSVMEQVEHSGLPAGDAVSIRHDLQKLIDAEVPEDAERIESMNGMALAALERITFRWNKAKSIKIGSDAEFQGLAVADLMDDLRLACAATEIIASKGSNVRAADPDVLERAELNKRLMEVSARVCTALEFVEELATKYGISAANNAWFRSCFNGVDDRIARMCSPAMDNKELRKAIASLEETMNTYDMIAPNLKEEKAKIDTLYPVYVEAARALGEPVRKMRHFKSASALEETMRALQQRQKRAEECAEIYQKLGASAYMCYAWDQELQAMGYSVHTRKKIREMVNYRPEHVEEDGVKLPFYQWDDGNATQLYSIDGQTSLQLIVHADGTTTMRAITESEDEEQVRKTQKKHCSGMKEVYRRLRENWFIDYDFYETADADEVFTVSDWLNMPENIWAENVRPAEPAAVQKKKRQTEQKKMAAQ